MNTTVVGRRLEMKSESAVPAGEFYVLRPDVRGGGPGTNVTIENEAVLLTPPSLIIRPPLGGIPEFPERPRLSHSIGRTKPPRDLEGGYSGYWLVSERLKRVFEDVDPDAFAFTECDYILPDGSEVPTHYLCDVVREVAALDRKRSRFKTKLLFDERTAEEMEMPSLVGGAQLVFDSTAVGDAHIFRMAERPSVIVCDDYMRQATRKAGIGVNPNSGGLNFKDAAGC
jgi:uncharacterized protein DUF1629